MPTRFKTGGANGTIAPSNQPTTRNIEPLPQADAGAGAGASIQVPPSPEYSTQTRSICRSNC
ncbi:predicted protein [Uncinocarpus reesii 1704]|uniref:Uncharacterized protein n=1 Tax=Uncinocarpus reesii (strain UAMH 1704) TaxID=336963 RepID=C4JE71_UNCRE|nr:uncharacterized protein UREG_00495 [Uncinocarpus reesii 1704]EEP75649.1 predicted protein [Uncinocarpus reesii 1704]